MRLVWKRHCGGRGVVWVGGEGKMKAKSKQEPGYLGKLTNKKACACLCHGDVTAADGTLAVKWVVVGGGEANKWMLAVSMP